MRTKSTHALQRALKRELQHQQWLRSNPALSAQARASQRTILKLYTVLRVRTGADLQRDDTLHSPCA